MEERQRARERGREKKIERENYELVFFFTEFDKWLVVIVIGVLQIENEIE